MDNVSYNLMSDFECSDKIIFRPKWNTYSFSLDREFVNKELIFIIPRDQFHLKGLLSTVLPNAVVFLLANEASILDISRHIEKMEAVHIIFTCQTGWHQGYDETAYSLFLALIQKLANKRVALHFDIVATSALYNPYMSHVIHPFDGTYIGFGQTMQKELSHWTIRIFNLDHFNQENLNRIRYQYFEKNATAPIHIVNNKYSISGLVPFTFPSNLAQKGFKEKGTYLIIGGNGGIGSALADYLIQRYHAHLILVGRSEPSPEQRMRYKDHSVIFEKVDICSSTCVDKLFSRHSTINGIIHSALVLDDATILTMTSSQLIKVIAPKVQGTFNMMNAIRFRPLDFVLFFSSIQSFIANSGQANYTAACVCKDAMAYLLNDAFLVNSKIINWGFWGSVGIVADDFYRNRMKELEIASIEVQEGMHIIESFLKSDVRQISVVKGSHAALQRLGIEFSDGHSQSHFPLDTKSNNDKTPQFISSMVNKYNPTSADVIRNKNSIKALDNYTKYRLQQVVLPDKVIPRYKQLQAAISIMDSASSPPITSVLDSYPELKPHITLLEKCLTNLPQILTGEQDALSILFPGGSFELVEPIYRNNPVADYYNFQVAETVLNYIREKIKLSDKTIRILEVGAGTGSTSQIVIPATAHYNVSYYYTDLSVAFLNKAMRSFSNYHFINYEIYNVEESYKENNYFDIIIATNVIHATRDIHKTITNIYNALRSKGILILNEITELQDFATLTFGLTEGWWLSQDPFRIPNSPLLNIKTWQEVLTSCCFDELATYGDDGQHIIVGYADKKNIKIDREISYLSSNTGNKPYTSNYQTIDQHPIKVWLKELISTVMLLPLNEIEDDLPFSQYGIDSLIAIELITPMSKKFGYVPATLLFEYPTINTLADYLSQIQVDSTNNESKSSEALGLMQVTGTNKIINEGKHAFFKDDIAIIGISGQFPMASDCDTLWSLLKEGKCTFTEVPKERWSESLSNKCYTQIGAFLEDINVFDHAFFNITPIEAERMDPQERLFLQTVYHAFQDAGLSQESLSGKEVGCYVGVMNHGYSWFSLLDKTQGNPSSLFWSIANRASYVFNWNGPSFAVDSACSSSLTALHTAMLGLKNGDCEIAVVGGVNLIAHPRQYEDLCQLHMLSPRGQCEPFAASCDGMVDGEGIVSIVIKRYEDAMAHQDKIYGVIRGSAVNAGGKANGYTAPNPDAQAIMIQKALRRAKLEESDIGYIEAHGTGTVLGDSIEIRGLTKAFAKLNKQSIPIGSIKGNLGHLESAAGLAAVVKVLLQFKNKMLVPSIACIKENPHLQLSDSPVYINKSLTRWPETLPMRACVSSFGAGGANAHVIIEACDDINTLQDLEEESESYCLFPLSAHSMKSLQTQINDLRQFVLTTQGSLAQISYGYCNVRSQLKYRTGFIANDKASLISNLNVSLQQIYNDRTTFGSIDCVEILNKFLHSQRRDLSLAKILMNAFIAGNSIPFDKLFTNRMIATIPNYSFDKHRHWVDAKESGFNRQESIVTQHTILGHNFAPAAFSITKLLETSNANVLQSVTWKNIILDINKFELSITDSKFQLKDKQVSTKIYCEGLLSKEILNDYMVNIPRDNQSRFITDREIYQYFHEMGYDYGNYFQAIKWAYVSQDSIYSLIEVNQDWSYKLSPVIIDAGLQTAILSRKPPHDKNNTIMVPYYIEKIIIFRFPKNESIYCICKPKNQMNDLSLTFDIELSDVYGRILIKLLGVTSVQTSINNFMHKLSDTTPMRETQIYELN
jgi:3-oxoacyl-(acyl-carrier-protein) synthase/SAM-dependent methyltransferase/acyl carrier protein